MYKRTNNDLQNTTHKTKDRATRSPLKPGVDTGAPEGLAVPVPLVTPIMLLLNDTNIIGYGKRLSTLIVTVLKSLDKLYLM